MSLKIWMYGVAVAAVVPALVGCASTGKKAAFVEPVQTPLTVLASTDSKTRGLRVVRSSHTAKMTSVKVMQGVFGAMSGQVVTGFKKEDLLGDPNEAIVDPALSTLPAALEKSLHAYAAAHPQDLPPATFKVKAEDWLLVYKSLGDADTPYELRFAVSMQARPADVGGVRQASVTQRCNPGVIELPIADWEADDYAKVKRRADELSEQCAAEFAQSFPELFHTAESVAVTQQ